MQLAAGHGAEGAPQIVSEMKNPHRRRRRCCLQILQLTLGRMGHEVW